MIPLLEHPNTDIGNQVVDVIHEIIHDEEGFTDQEDLEIISKLAFNCLKADLLLYFSNHARNIHKTTDNEDPDDNQAIFKIFQVIEDILELYHQPERDNLRVVEFYSRLNDSRFIEYLIEMFKQDPKTVKTESLGNFLSPGDYANRLYAAELSSTIFQLSAMDLKNENKLIQEAVNKTWTSSIDELIIIESLLVSISPYRLRDPIDSDEQEYLFNLFDCLGVLLLNSSAARKFFSSERCEGFQLFLMLLKEVNIARIRAIQIIDYVLAPEDENSNLSVDFINSGGLKVISSIFMGKGVTKLVKKYPKLLLSIESDEGHVCAIVASLFKNIPIDSSAYFRLITKFVENSGEKFLRLTQLHEKYSEKLKKFDQIHGITRENQMEEEWLLDRINAGLFVLQQIDICLLLLENSTKLLNLIENNSETKLEIENDLFIVVLKESETVFKLSETVLGEVKENVKGFISEIDEKSKITIIPLLKTFI